MNTEGLHNLPLGWTASLAAKATFSDGTTKDVTTSAQWASSDSSVLAVNAGTIVVEGFGSTKITAIYQGIIGSITVNVAPLNISRGTEIWRLTTTVSSVTGPWPACLSIWQPVGTSFDSMLGITRTDARITLDYDQ